MKKATFLLLVLVLLSPAAVMACTCCQPSSHFDQDSIQGPMHSCCDMITTDVETCGIFKEETVSVLNVLSLPFLASDFLPVSMTSVLNLDSAFFEAASPPIASKEASLYLSLQTLRL